MSNSTYFKFPKANKMEYCYETTVLPILRYIPLIKYLAGLTRNLLQVAWTLY